MYYFYIFLFSKYWHVCIQLNGNADDGCGCLCFCCCCKGGTRINVDSLIIGV